jgi:hypothetical protein
MTIFNKKALSLVEYVVLFVIIIGAFLIMRSAIQRGIFGMWANSGQTFSFGRQYDPQTSVACDFDPASKQWYDHNCVAAQCGSNPSCFSGAIAGCASSYCTQLNQ